MKKTLPVVISLLLLSGCGFKMVKKDEAIANVEKLYGNLNSMRHLCKDGSRHNELCSPQMELEVEAIQSGLKVLIEEYLK